MLWANLRLLFWLSFVSFTTGWMGENRFAAAPTALNGSALLMAAIACWTWQQLIIAAQGRNSVSKKIIGSDWKGRLSPIAYAKAIPIAIPIPMAFVSRWVSLCLYLFVALVWQTPNQRIDKAMSRK